MNREKFWVVLFITLGLAGGVILFAWLSAAGQAFFYGPLVNSVDPTGVQWWHWFVWSGEMTNVILFVHFPAVWWTMTLLMTGITCAAFLLYVASH